jgi:hypothetical protein
VFLPVILRQAVPTTNPYPLDGSTLLNNGLCCAGGYYGDLITLTVFMTATSPITEVTQMRHASRRGSSCFTQEELAAYPWVPYATQVLIPIEINFSNWIGFYAGVQFRDAAGFLSPPLCDDISIEGMPPPPELKPSPIIHLWFSRLSPFGFSGNPQTGSPFNYRDTVPIPFSRSS